MDYVRIKETDFKVVSRMDPFPFNHPNLWMIKLCALTKCKKKAKTETLAYNYNIFPPTSCMVISESFWTTKFSLFTLWTRVRIIIDSGFITGARVNSWPFLAQRLMSPLKGLYRYQVGLKFSVWVNRALKSIGYLITIFS